MARLLRLHPIALIASLFLFGIAAEGAAHELQAAVRDQGKTPVEGAVVVALPVNRSLMDQIKPEQNLVDQVDKEFIPYVKAIYVGSQVHFPNKDNIRHHVYSFSPAKRFELPLYSGSAAPPVLFDRPGVVVLGCNIHDWMVGYIYVADSPFFAKTDHQGQVRLAGLPAGDYTVRVWHPQMQEAETATARRLTVGTQPAQAEWSITLQPLLRIARPLPGQALGYR